MRALVQSVKSGELSLVSAPRGAAGPTEVLVRTSRSTVSSGTEKAVRKLARASLLQKARARPDLVRKVIQRAGTDGVTATLRAVRSRLDDEMPLGYSAVGVVEAVGEHVPSIAVGQRVATGGAGHADVQVVSAMLAVPVPDGVSDENAAMTTIAAIALHGLRQASIAPGMRVAVVGLGLVGQISARIARASGCEVVGIDVDAQAVERAKRSGVHAVVEGPDATTAVVDWSGGMGVDCVQVTAATRSSSPVMRATERCRDRGEIVIVGDVGLELDRRPFYDKELSLRFARSYGPGRYETSYEDWAVDYPIGHVRWTEQRNMQALLAMMDRGALDLEDLVTHEFELADFEEAYATISDAQSGAVAVQLTYSSAAAPAPERVVRRSAPAVSVAPDRRLRVGLIGAGGFVRSTLYDAIVSSGIGPVVAVASGAGTTARFLADRKGIPCVASSAADLIADDGVDLVVIASTHRTHAELTVEALAAGKHVFVEKPLALSDDELDAVVDAFERHAGALAVGFNRRHAPAVAAAAARLGQVAGPRVMSYRVNAGPVDPAHWYADRREGGRLLGEVCHFVDTCNALVGDERPSEVHAFGAGGPDAVLSEDLVLTIRYDGGSMASILYAAGGHGSMAKERLEILAGGHSVVLDNFAKATLDGKPLEGASPGKGHVEQFAHLGGAIGTARQRLDAEAALTTSAVTLAAVESLLRGAAVEPRRFVTADPGRSDG